MVAAGEGSAEKVIIKLNGSHTPRAFRLDGGQPRLVFDFFDVRYRFGKPYIDGIGGDIVAGVRAGRHQNPLKTRVVVDIVPGSSFEYDQTFDVSSNSLEITFYPGPPGEQSGSRTQHIQVGKAKIVYETAPPGDAQEASQKEPEPGQKDSGQLPADRSGDSPRVPDQPADVKEQAPPPQEVADSREAPADVKEPVPPPQEVTDSREAPADVKEPVPPQQEVTDSREVPAEPPADVKEPVPPQEIADTREAPVDQPVEQTGTGIAETEGTGTADPDEAPPVLLDVSFEQSINNSETVLFKLSHFYPPLVFGIEKGEPRVVCDFHDALVEADVPSKIEVGGKYVNRITVTSLKDPDKVRVELELVPNRHYDLQQLFFKEDNLFVVIVNELSETGAAAQK